MWHNSQQMRLALQSMLASTVLGEVHTAQNHLPACGIVPSTFLIRTIFSGGVMLEGLVAALLLGTHASLAALLLHCCISASHQTLSLGWQAAPWHAE